MTLTLYGIKACDTMKKAMRWLEENGLEYQFHDYKKQPIDADSLTRWCNEHGWEVILNRKGTTFRKLDDEQKANIDQHKAITLMLSNNSMIKRPVLEMGERTLVGFSADSYHAELV